MSVLNSFHDNIRFTYEQENNNRLPFLDILFIGDDEKINTTVFRKDTHNDLYLHWDTFSPINWKREILKLLISRAYMICSDQSLLEKELGHLKKILFIKRMVTLMWMIIKVMKTVKETINTETILTNQLGTLQVNNDKVHFLILAYDGPKGKNIIKSMNNNIQRNLLNNVKSRITDTDRKLGTKFQIKGLTKNQHEHDLI